ncbi:MAG: RNHCP domain-containing protein [Candidatus Shapirobacteria bacterium]
MAIFNKNNGFFKTKEDFACDVCGNKVFGSGFTNHCPECLWSKHVDLDPGDRQAGCGGLMKPLALDQKKGCWRILHQCQTCGFKRWNKASKEDNLEVLLNNAS